MSLTTALLYCCSLALPCLW